MGNTAREDRQWKLAALPQGITRGQVLDPAGKPLVGGSYSSTLGASSDQLPAVLTPEGSRWWLVWLGP